MISKCAMRYMVYTGSLILGELQCAINFVACINNGYNCSLMHLSWGSARILAEGGVKLKVIIDYSQSLSAVTNVI